MARNSTERLGGVYDLESRGSAFSCTPEQESTPQISKHLQILSWFSRERCCLRDHLYGCNSYMNESNGIQKFLSLYLTHSCRYLQRVLVQGGLHPRTHA